MAKFTHKQICEIGTKFLKRFGCSVILEEFVSATSECPDLLGFKSGYSILLEAKVSRSDFLTDKNKYFRKKEDKGMGNYRLFICPEGLIKEEELPKGWGLIYVTDKLKAKTIVGPKSNSFIGCGVDYKESCLKSENAMLVSAMRRVNKEKLKDCNYKVFILTELSEEAE